MVDVNENRGLDRIFIENIALSKPDPQSGLRPEIPYSERAYPVKGNA